MAIEPRFQSLPLPLFCSTRVKGNFSRTPRPSIPQKFKNWKVNKIFNSSKTNPRRNQKWKTKIVNYQTVHIYYLYLPPKKNSTIFTENFVIILLLLLVRGKFMYAWVHACILPLDRCVPLDRWVSVRQNLARNIAFMRNEKGVNSI